MLSQELKNRVEKVDVLIVGAIAQAMKGDN